MQKYINFLDKHKYKTIIIATLLVALFSISLKDLAYEGSYKIWFDKDSKILKDYENFRMTFSGDDTFVVAFKDEQGIFTPKAINAILYLTEEFKKIDGVSKVDSLSNYQYISSEDDDIIIEDFIYDTRGLVSKKVLALKDELIVNQLISQNAKTTMIAIRLSSAIGADENVNIAVMSSIESLLESYKQKSEYKFYISGAPAITASLVNVSQSDAMLLMPLGVLMVVGLLFVIFRDMMGVLIPSVVIVFTFLITLSIQMLLGYKLNNFTVNIPSFISAIAIAGSMHLFLAWVYYKNKEHKNKESLLLALKNNIVPIAMTSLTTAVGFASLGFSSIEPISTLGVAITSGALIAFIFTIVLVPSILLTLNDNYLIKPVKFLNLLEVKGYGEFIIKHDRKIVGVSLLLFLLLGAGLKDLKVDSNSINYFEDTTVVKSGSNFIQENLTGPMIYEVIVDSKVKEGIKNPEFLKEVVVFEIALKSEFESVTFSSSLKDVVLRMQERLNATSDEKMPQTQNLVAQYLLLYSMSLPQGMELNDKIDVSERYLRVSLNTNVQNTSQDLKMIEWIKNYWSKNTSYSADVQGQSAIFAYMQSSVTDTLINSITATLLIVTLAMFFIFKNLKMLWLFVLPNIAPIVVVAGVMGHLGINVDIGVAISAAVILGIAVDDTIHFFSKYFDAIKTKPLGETIDYVISHSGNAMILTTLILSVTFSIFTISSFIPNVNFAIVTIIALNIALVLDLVLLPALLSIVSKKDRR
ncbi:MAG: MMPL family transporter [Campylobacterota bacterium]|nr:MMPL family transporter [Campylobacterota bacterium]